MNILVIIGDYILTNSSANLCHLAYLRGLIDAGHNVILLSADGRDYIKDESMIIPENIKCYSFYGTTLYEKLSIKKKERKKLYNAGGSEFFDNLDRTEKKKIIEEFKHDVLFTLYGVHGIFSKFVRKAKHFKSDIVFDFVLSISTPASSHFLAYELIRSRNVICKHWIQIWEDPWYNDAYGFTKRKEIYKEEKRLLSVAERICYVSPLTLENQQKIFPELAGKMFWVAVPSYYEANYNTDSVMDNLFGYFGEYRKPARDLEPFYEAAKSTGIEVNICGSTNLQLMPTEKIHIFQRLPLSELKPIESRTGVLVFLSNCIGGQIPGKIYQYAATNKAILFILDGTEDEKKTIRSMFEPLSRFYFCENKKEDIERAIRAICRNELGNIKNVPLSQFEPKNIVERILNEGMNRTNEQS